VVEIYEVFLCVEKEYRMLAHGEHAQFPTPDHAVARSNNFPRLNVDS
jgi:hypothetical protein